MPLPDGRVLFIPWSATNPLIYDPKWDAITTSAASTPAELQTGSDFTGGALLADGTVLLLPGTYSDLLECRIWDPEPDMYTAAPELAMVPALGLGAYLGGCVLPDGRVVFMPWASRHLVV